MPISADRFKDRLEVAQLRKDLPDKILKIFVDNPKAAFCHKELIEILGIDTYDHTMLTVVNAILHRFYMADFLVHDGATRNRHWMLSPNYGKVKE